jgi:Cu2+-exporting ATPase
LERIVELVPPSFSSQTIALDVTGMKCAGCVRAVEQALQQCDGVIGATVNLATEVASVEYLPDSVDPQDLAASLTEAGFPSHIRRPLVDRSMQDPQIGTTPDLQTRRQLEMQQQVKRLAIATVLLLLSALGHLEQFTGFAIPGLSNIWLHCGLATVALLGPGRAMAIDGWRGLRRNAPNMNTLVSLGTFTAYTASLVALLIPQLGWECFFDEPVMLVGFILLGRTLEQHARHRAAAAFQALLALQPTIARLIPTGLSLPGETEGDPQLATLTPQQVIEIPADCVRIGEWLQVLPGDKIPVDGEIVVGQTTVDEAMLTGESIPVLKQRGDFVAAGTLNQSGAIALCATRTGNETTLAQIITLVETAQTRKAPIQKLADTVAGFFTYGVMAIAALTFLFWYGLGVRLFPHVLLGGGETIMGHEHLLTHDLVSLMAPDPHHITPLLLSLKLAIAVLVVACPCALGLATPTAILVGSGIAAERGVLIRGGDILERVHQLDTIILDKTGTLTTGKPTVTDCILTDQFDAVGTSSSGSQVPVLTPQQRLLQLAATVESGTRHPLAIAIQQQAQHQHLTLLPAYNFLTEPGYGVAATVQVGLDHRVPVILGTSQWLAQQQISVNDREQTQADQLSSAGKTVVYVAVDGVLAGLIAVTDTLRPDAVITVSHLKRMGFRVMIMTGDRRETAHAIARSLQLDPADVLAEVRPDAKAAIIAQLQAEGHRVAMVGDGINDAPALAQTDVGLALHAGTDVAVETAGIILMQNRLTDVVEAIRLSRATFNKIRQNLFWAFAYNILGIPLAAGILLPSLEFLLSPAAAGAMMAFSSVSVVTNSLLLYLTIPRIQFPTSQEIE